MRRFPGANVITADLQAKSDYRPQRAEGCRKPDSRPGLPCGMPADGASVRGFRGRSQRISATARESQEREQFAVRHAVKRPRPERAAGGKRRDAAPASESAWGGRLRQGYGEPRRSAAKAGG